MEARGNSVAEKDTSGAGLLRSLYIGWARRALTCNSPGQGTGAELLQSRSSGRYVRSERFPPLTEAAKHQAENVFTDVEGTLAGFRSTTYAQVIGVAGFHLHFLRQDKQAGGHPLDYRVRAGKVQICTVHDLRVELSTSAEFLKTNFEDRALNEKIKAEG